MQDSKSPLFRALGAALRPETVEITDTDYPPVPNKAIRITVGMFKGREASVEHEDQRSVRARIEGVGTILLPKDSPTGPYFEEVEACGEVRLHEGRDRKEAHHAEGQ